MDKHVGTLTGLAIVLTGLAVIGIGIGIPTQQYGLAIVGAVMLGLAVVIGLISFAIKAFARN